MLANADLKTLPALAVILCMTCAAAPAWSQLPFGPPPVDDGFVPVGQANSDDGFVPAGPPGNQLPAYPGTAPAQTPYPPAPNYRSSAQPPVTEPRGGVDVEPAPAANAIRQDRLTYGGGINGNPKPVGNSQSSDASLVGPRYAPQPVTSEPIQDNASFRPAPPQRPAGPIQYPIARQPGGQILAQAETNEQAKVFARVGDQIILGGDFLERVDRIMEANKDRIPASAWETQRLILIKEVLDKMIRNKLVIADARRKIPEEALPNVERQVTEQFYKSQIPKMMADAEVETKVELEAVLKEAGSSIEEQRKIFLERAIGAQWIRQSIDMDREVTHSEMWQYYQEHREDYRNEARAKWQELHVSIDSAGSREKAFQKIAQLGNDVLQRGVSFDVVARTHSEGLTAKQGGMNDWTSRGSLKSDKLDRALFELPLGKMSPIIEEPDGFYIIRVVEREPENYTPFRDAQVEIAEKIKSANQDKQVEAYYARLEKEVPVWTIFDDPQVAAKLPSTHR